MTASHTSRSGRAALLGALAAGAALAVAGLGLMALVPVTPPDAAFAARQKAWRDGPTTSRPPGR